MQKYVKNKRKHDISVLSRVNTIERVVTTFGLMVHPEGCPHHAATRSYTQIHCRRRIVATMRHADPSSRSAQSSLVQFHSPVTAFLSVNNK